MKLIEYTSDKYEGKIFSREFCLEDLLDNITGFSKEIVKAVCIEFLEMMTKDIIDENDYFLFPIWKFAYINIIDISHVDHPEYRYDVVNGTDSFFQPVIAGDGINKIRGKSKWMYNMRFIGKTEKYFQSVIAQNHHY